MRWLVAIIAWTLVVAIVFFLTPGLVGFVETPGCDLVGLSEADSARCQALWARQNDVIWRAQTSPILALSLGGYGLIGLLAWLHRRS